MIPELFGKLKGAFGALGDRAANRLYGAQAEANKGHIWGDLLMGLGESYGGGDILGPARQRAAQSRQAQLRNDWRARFPRPRARPDMPPAPRPGFQKAIYYHDDQVVPRRQDFPRRRNYTLPETQFSSSAPIDWGPGALPHRQA